MHRSGTSALARSLLAFGVDLGDRLMPSIAGDNDKGFWEDLDLYELNQQILEALGADWNSPSPIAEAQFARDAVLALRPRAAALVDGKLSRCQVCGVKDPRLSRLLPFWKPIFRDLEVKPVYLLAARNPISVARSLQLRNHLQPGQSYLLWMRHTLDALDGTQGEPRLCVDYDEMMLDAPRQLMRIGRFLGRAPDAAAAREYCSEFLEARLRRARHFIGDLEADAGAESGVSQLYGMLRRVAIDDRPQAWALIERFVRAAISTPAPG